jgi:hypothetical protein
MNTVACGHCRLHFQRNPISSFFSLLQKGFYVEITTGNLKNLLGRICEINTEEVRDRIQTVFLNGKPVDDMETTFVEDGDCLALSAAMPGLVGATMRSGGVLAGLRQSISHRPQQIRSNPRHGILSIKLFNLLIMEIGPRLLQKGILVESDDIGKMLESILKAERGNCKMAQLNSHMIDTEALGKVDRPEGPGLILLKITFGQQPDMALPHLNSFAK